MPAGKRIAYRSCYFWFSCYYRSLHELRAQSSSATLAWFGCYVWSAREWTRPLLFPWGVFVRMRAAILGTTLLGSVAIFVGTVAVPESAALTQVASDAAFVQPTSVAASTLSLGPESRTIVEGSDAVLRGQAAGAKLGTQVELQHKVDNGWVTVRERRLSISRKYAFTVSPLRGQHEYRVLQRRQLGQPRVTSPSAEVLVRWRPVIEVRSDLIVYDVEVSGRVDGVSNATLIEQRRFHPDAAWITTRPRSIGATGEFGRYTYNDGWYQLRYVLPADGLRMRAVSDVVEIAHEDDSVHQIVPTGTYYSTGYYEGVAIKAEAGEEVYLAVDDPAWILDGDEAVIGPDGVDTGTVFRGGAGKGLTGHFQASEAGWYTLYLGHASSHVTASLVARKPATLNGDPVDVYPLATGQPVDLVFDGQRGDVVTWGGTPPGYCVIETMWQPDGRVLWPLAGSGPYDQGWWVLTTSGEHRLRIAPCEPRTIDTYYTLNNAATTDLALDGTAVATTTRPGQGAVAKMRLERGTRFMPMTSGQFLWRPTVVGPDGQALYYGLFDGRGFTAPTTGVYRLVYFFDPPDPGSGDDGDVGDVEFSATSPVTAPAEVDARKRIRLSTTVPRELGVTFTGQTGQLVGGYTSRDIDQYRDQVLLGPDGETVDPAYNSRRAIWRLPANGTYSLLTATPPGSADFGVLTPTLGPDLSRDSATQLTIDDPCDSVIAHFTATTGETLTLSATSHTFPTYYNANGDFGITMNSPSGMKYEVDSGLTFEAWESGKWTVLLQGWGTQSTGTVDLALTPS